METPKSASTTSKFLLFDVGSDINFLHLISSYIAVGHKNSIYGI